MTTPRYTTICVSPSRYLEVLERSAEEWGHKRTHNGYLIAGPRVTESDLLAYEAVGKRGAVYMCVVKQDGTDRPVWFSSTMKDAPAPLASFDPRL